MPRASLVLILLLAAYLRFFGLDWDPGHQFHPDERMMSGVATGAKLSEGFEPHFYSYGQLLPYLYRLTGSVLATPRGLAIQGVPPETLRIWYWSLLLVCVVFLAGLMYRWGDPRARFWIVVGLAALALSSGAAATAYAIAPWYVFLVFALAFASAVAARLSASAASVAGVLWLLAFVAAVPPGDGHMLDYDRLKLTGRVWSALSSVGTVYVTYLLGRKFFRSERVGLLGAFFLATAVLSIQLAHFNVSDSFITFLGALVALFAFGISETGDWRSYLLAGAAFGLALAAKTSSATLVVFLLVAHALAVSKGLRYVIAPQRANYPILIFVGLGIVGLSYQASRFAHDLFYKHVWFAWTLTAIFTALGLLSLVAAIRRRALVTSSPHLWGRFSACLVVAFAFFALGSPWSLIKLKAYLDSMRFEWAMVTRSDVVYTFQFKNQIPYVFPIRNLLDWSLGWALGIFGLLGLTLAPRHVLFFSWPLVFLLFVTSWSTQFVRYYLPVVPFLCLSAAASLQWLASRRRVVAYAFAGLIVVFSLLRSFAYQNIFRQEHPWVQISRWMFQNIEPGKWIVTENWDDSLPIDLGPPLHPHRFPQDQFGLYETFGKDSDDTPERREYYVKTLQKADYLSISTKKLWYTLVDASPHRRRTGFRRYPLASRYYRALWSGQLGFDLVAQATSYPKLFGFEWPTDSYEETASIYEHPHPYVFKKTRALSSEELMARLSTEAGLPSPPVEEMIKGAIVGKEPRGLAETRKE